MKLQLTILFVFIGYIGVAQMTAIPDPVFEQNLIDLGHDIGPIDGVVPTANISSLTSLWLVDLDLLDTVTITDLTGIEDFQALENFQCDNYLISNVDLSQNLALISLRINGVFSTIDLSNNTLLAQLSIIEASLNSIDLTQNTLLEYISIEHTNITALDVSQNAALTSLSCGYNHLTELDVINNTSLNHLFCNYNQLFYLDVSQNTALTFLYAAGNKLQCLNLKNGNNINLIDLCLESNDSLRCITVDDSTLTTSCWSDALDWSSIFQEDCMAECAGVGVEELPLTNTIVFPNPSKGKYTINLGQTMTNVSANLFNAMGQLIETYQPGTKDYFNIEIFGPKGLYVLILNYDNEATTSIQILKQ